MSETAAVTLLMYLIGLPLADYAACEIAKSTGCSPMARYVTTLLWPVFGLCVLLWAFAESLVGTVRSIVRRRGP